MQRSTAVTESKVHPRVHERTEVDPVEADVAEMKVHKEGVTD